MGKPVPASETDEEAASRNCKKTIEAALFMSPATMSVYELAKIAATNVANARVLLNELIHDYTERDSAIEIREDANGFRMAVRGGFEQSVMHLASSPQFHKGVMKTLAYIAYKQPIKQSDVIKFRNTKAYDHIALLVEKGFVTREHSRSTFVLRTTRKFHQHFSSGAKGQGLAARQQEGAAASGWAAEE